MTIIANCALCGKSIDDQPHQHHWKHVSEWDVTICHPCVSSNWDGIVIEQYPKLAEHLRSKGIEVKRNAKGWVDIP